MGLRKYPPKITKDEWNNLIDFLGGETIDALLSQNKLADKFTQTEHDALSNPHHPKIHGNTEHTAVYITTCDRLPGTPANLGEALAEGISAKFAREDHVHKLLSKVAKDAVVTGVRKLVNFTGAGVTVTDDPTNDKLDINIPGGGGGGGLISHITFLAQTATAIWTNMPAALTEFLGLTRQRSKDDLTNATQARIIVNVMVAGAATPAKIRAQYSTDLTNWYYLDGSSGPSVDINTTGLKVSAWVNLAAGAKADVYLRIVGLDGDGKADPDFGGVQLQFK